MVETIGQAIFTADTVNSVGLLLDIAGVVLLFLFGLPSKVQETPGAILMWGARGSEEEEERKKYEHYRRLSHMGLGLLVLGFLLQIISNYCP